jgi:hypothetical protein
MMYLKLLLIVFCFAYGLRVWRQHDTDEAMAWGRVVWASIVAAFGVWLAQRWL